MKIALWGKGKTGSKVIEVHGEDNIIGPFGKASIPTIDQLNQADVILLFFPGSFLDEHLELLLKSKAPIVSGCTGYNYGQDFKAKLQDKNKTWIQANNFSIQMMGLKPIITMLGKLQSILKDANWSMQEIHHTKKLDAPSGTALTWQDWLGLELPIESIREGDEIGTHKICIEDKDERITLEHNSLDRKLFAKGAVFACKMALTEKLPAGFYEFADLIAEKIK